MSSTRNQIYSVMHVIHDAVDTLNQPQFTGSISLHARHQKRRNDAIETPDMRVVQRKCQRQNYVSGAGRARIDLSQPS